MSENEETTEDITEPDVPTNAHGGVDIDAALRARPAELTPELESMGLTLADLVPDDTSTSPNGVSSGEGDEADPLRSTPQFTRAEQHLKLLGIHTDDDIASMDTAEVFRRGDVAQEVVRRESMLRQQLAEALKAGEAAASARGASQVLDPQLVLTMRKTLEPVYEAQGEEAGDAALRAALAATMPTAPNQTTTPVQPATAQPTTPSDGGAEDLRYQIKVARDELVGDYPQLSDPSKLRTACSHSDSMGVPFVDAKSAIRAAAEDLWGKASAGGKSTKATAQRVASPSEPAQVRRRGPDKRTTEQQQWALYKGIRKHPGDVEAAKRSAGLI